MKSYKKILFLLPVLLLSSCNFTYTYIVPNLPKIGGGGAIDDEEEDYSDAGTYNIKVWVDDKIADLTRSQIKSFVSKSDGNYVINATVEPQSEGTAASQMLQDVESGADIFIFAQDQLSRLKVAGAVAKVTGKYASFVSKNNSAESVAAASLGTNVYAFPVTSDNGYFLYYDKRIIPDADAGDMSKILEDCKSAKKRINFEARSNGFYAASYFMATDLTGTPDADGKLPKLCHSTWKLDEHTGKFTSYDDNFAGDNGVIAANGIKELDNTSLVATNSLASKLGDSAAAVVSGIWEYDIAASRLKDNLGCAELPKFTVGNKTYHLGSFDGYKLMGVKPQVDAKKASVCLKLARYLTSGECQTQRFKEVSWGPTNLESSARTEVKNHPGLAALAKQHVYATQQSQCPGAWFVSLATTVASIKNNYNDSQIKAALNKYQVGLDELLDED